MLLSERPAFNDEMNALLDKYRLKLFIGYYFSIPGDKELCGVTAACNFNMSQKAMGIISDLSMDLLRIAEPYEIAIKGL